MGQILKKKNGKYRNNSNKILNILKIEAKIFKIGIQNWFLFSSIWIFTTTFYYSQASGNNKESIECYIIQETVIIYKISNLTHFPKTNSCSQEPHLSSLNTVICYFWKTPSLGDTCSIIIPVNASFLYLHSKQR